MRKSSLKNIQEALHKDLSSCVLITCEHPSQDGQMKVELTYHGDPALAVYLLQGAQRHLEEEEEQIDSSCPTMCLIK